MSEKKPQPGEFWEWAGCRLRVIGSRANGAIVAEHECGSLEFGCSVRDGDMKHLPECDSFEWQPKPNYVRLWTHRTSGTVCTATDEKYLAYPEIWTEIKHDGTGFYLVDQQR